MHVLSETVYIIANRVSFVHIHILRDITVIGPKDYRVLHLLTYSKLHQTHGKYYSPLK